MMKASATPVTRRATISTASDSTGQSTKAGDTKYSRWQPFGWGNSHLHEFSAGDGEGYGVADPTDDLPGSISCENVRLTTVLPTSTLSYVYDFGDGWDHRITIEKIQAADAVITLPFCIGGAGATPPEDSGGPPGCAALVRAMADPNDSEHAHLNQWIGVDSWDPKAFDSAMANDKLAAIKL